jgi:hypothetical protein
MAGMHLQREYNINTHTMQYLSKVQVRKATSGSIALILQSLQEYSFWVKSSHQKALHGYGILSGLYLTLILKINV